MKIGDYKNEFRVGDRVIIKFAYEFADDREPIEGDEYKGRIGIIDEVIEGNGQHKWDYRLDLIEGNVLYVNEECIEYQE